LLCNVENTQKKINLVRVKGRLNASCSRSFIISPAECLKISFNKTTTTTNFQVLTSSLTSAIHAVYRMKLKVVKYHNFCNALFKIQWSVYVSKYFMVPYFLRVKLREVWPWSRSALDDDDSDDFSSFWPFFFFLVFCWNIIKKMNNENGWWCTDCSSSYWYVLLGNRSVVGKSIRTFFGSTADYIQGKLTTI